MLRRRRLVAPSLGSSEGEPEAAQVRCAVPSVMSIREIKAECSLRGVATDGLLERNELIDALRIAREEAAVAAAETPSLGVSAAGRSPSSPPTWMFSGPSSSVPGSLPDPASPPTGQLEPFPSLNSDSLAPEPLGLPRAIDVAMGAASTPASSGDAPQQDQPRGTMPFSDGSGGRLGDRQGNHTPQTGDGGGFHGSRSTKSTGSKLNASSRYAAAAKPFKAPRLS